MQLSAYQLSTFVIVILSLGIGYVLGFHASLRRLRASKKGVGLFVRGVRKRVRGVGRREKVTIYSPSKGRDEKEFKEQVVGKEVVRREG